jgi:benzoylformate decarboxylase
MEGHGPHIPEAATLVQLVDDPTVAAWAPVGIAIVTSLKPGVTALLAAPPPRRRTAPPPRVPPPPLPAGRLTDRYLLQRIAALRPAGGIIVEEAASSRGPMHDYLPILEPDTFFTCASGGLGHGLPAAIGIALARRTQKVIALLGDGSSMYAIQGLWSAAELGVPVAFVIVKNGSYNALNEFGPHFALSKLPGTDLPHIDFCALARSQGVDARYVDSCADLDGALEAAFGATRPLLVEVAVVPHDPGSGDGA